MRGGFSSFWSFYTFIQNLKEDTTNAVEQLKEAESEAKALRTMTQRMILTHEEMVVFQNLILFIIACILIEVNNN